MTPEELEKIEKLRDLKKLTEYVMDIKDDSKEVEKFFASKKEDIFIELAKRSPSIIEGSKGQRILHIAIDHEAYRCITYLVNNGVDFKEKNKEGKTALERLREKGVLIVLDFPLCNKQANVPYSLDFSQRPAVTFEEIVMEKAKRNKSKTLV